MLDKLLAEKQGLNFNLERDSRIEMGYHHELQNHVLNCNENVIDGFLSMCSDLD